MRSKTVLYSIRALSLCRLIHFKKLPCFAFMLNGNPIFLHKMVDKSRSLSALVHLQGKSKIKKILVASALISSQPAGRSVSLAGVQSLAIARTFDGRMLDPNTRTASMDDLKSIFKSSQISYTFGHMATSSSTHSWTHILIWGETSTSAR